MQNETDHKHEFEKLCARAKRGGLLRAAYPDHGIAIVAIPPPVAATPPPVATPPPQAAQASA